MKKGKNGRQKMTSDIKQDTKRDTRLGPGLSSSPHKQLESCKSTWMGIVVSIFNIEWDHCQFIS